MNQSDRLICNLLDLMKSKSTDSSASGQAEETETPNFLMRAPENI